MGSGASKKRSKIVQQEVQRPLPTIETKPSNRSPPQSPQLPAVSSRRSLVRSRAPSLPSQVSPKQSITSLRNGTEYLTPFRKLDNNILRENDDIPLPSIPNPISKSSSRSSTRASSLVPLPPINRSQVDLDSYNESHKHSHRKSSTISQKQIGRCSHCPHCQRTRTSNHQTTSPVPEPKWLTENPGPNQISINMDRYDVEAVKEKIISQNGHLPGSYDYRPHLTMEQINDYDQTKENYYTQPIVANTKPRISPTRTPFPDYHLLQRREQRLNKPNTLPLFED